MIEKKLDGNRFVVELDGCYEDFDETKLERMKKKLKAELGEDARIVITPSGIKLRQLPSYSPYCVRQIVGDLQEEVYFATHDEMMAYLSKEAEVTPDAYR
jgi:hypothetical protein